MPCSCQSKGSAPKPVVPFSNKQKTNAQKQTVQSSPTTRRQMGSFTAPLKNLDDDAKKVLTDNFDKIKQQPGLQNILLDNLLKGGVYAKQIVAGTNYKFVITHMNKKYELIIWKRLNGMYQMTSFKNI